MPERSAYDRMMAELQLQDAEQDRAINADAKRSTLKGGAESKRVVETKSASAPFAERKLDAKDNDDRRDAKQRDTSDGSGGGAVTAPSNRRYLSFPPAARRSRGRSSKSHNSDADEKSDVDDDDDDDDDDSDNDREAAVRHAHQDAFAGGPNVTKATSAAEYRVEINALRSFLNKAPKSGAPAIRCFVQRDRHGLHRLHPIYRLYLEDGKQFLLCAQKRSTSKTSNYLLTMEKNPTDRRSALIVGKLRANWSGSEYTIFDDGLSPSKTALEANVRGILGLIEFGYDEMGPGRMNVRIPPVQDTGAAVRWKDPDLDKPSPIRDTFDATLNTSALMLRNKRPQYDAKTGGHVLDFQGRITMPSIKNFQMQSDSHGDETVLQFGRVSCQPPGPRTQCKCHKSTFVMDVKHPLSPVQAFAICLATLDSKVADAKMYESVTKLIKKKTK